MSDFDGNTSEGDEYVFDEVRESNSTHELSDSEVEAEVESNEFIVEKQPVTNLPKKSKKKSKKSKSKKMSKAMLSEKVVNLTSVAKLEAFVDKSTNYIVMFYFPKIPSNMMTDFTFTHIAHYLHPTNDKSDSVPITLAKFDIYKHREEMKTNTKFFETPETFAEMMKHLPLLYVKRGPEDTPLLIPDKPGYGYDDATLLSLIANTFQDESLKPMTNTLDNLMNNPEPEFVFFYSELEPLIPRFASAYNKPSEMLDVREGNASLMFWFLRHPEVARRGLSVSLFKMDRPDLKLTTIYDMAEQKEYAFRFTQDWFDKQGLVFED